MDPECNVSEIRGAEGLQKTVKRVMPLLELELVSPHERQPAQMPDQQVVAGGRLDDGRRNMRRDGNKLADRTVWAEHGLTKFREEASHQATIANTNPTRVVCVGLVNGYVLIAIFPGILAIFIWAKDPHS